ncbi:MAG: hypothetical protein CTY34_11165 [Methylobacter sp.]|nr:MAG: hypothetical protein CTY34_11165 [Methylobacter sp.]
MTTGLPNALPPHESQAFNSVQSKIFKWYERIIAGIILILVYLNIPEYTYAVINQAILPKYFYFLMCALLAPVVFFKIDQLLRYLISPYSLLILLLISINFISLIDANKDTVELVLTRNQLLLLSIMLGFFFSSISTGSFKSIFPFLLVINLACVVTNFIAPGLMYPLRTPGAVIGRAAGTFINPTQISEVLLITCLFAIPVVSRPYRIILTLSTGIGVALTFTRGSFVIGFLLFILLCATRKMPRLALVFPTLLLLFLPVLVANFNDYLLSREDLIFNVDDLLSRLDFFQTYVVNDVSALERFEVMNAALNLFFQNPLLGAGVGYTTLWPYRVGPHNQLLVLAAEYGVSGILLWLLLAVMLWKGRYFKDRAFQHMACFIFIGLSMFTHNILELAYWLLSISLLSRPSQTE